MGWAPIDLRCTDEELGAYPQDPADLVAAMEQLEVLLRRPWWHEHAACRGQGCETWFPGRGDGTDSAKAICTACPVTYECARAGANEPAGVWAGMSPAERRAAAPAA